MKHTWLPSRRGRTKPRRSMLAPSAAPSTPPATGQSAELSPRGDGCMMSYSGRHYADGAREEAFRLMIVGLDHGEHGFASYRGRQSSIEGYYVYNTNKFNSHYAGVVKTAAAVLGQEAGNCGADCARSGVCRKARGDTQAFCVIERIMQPNIVKCVRMEKTSNAIRRHKGNGGQLHQSPLF